MSLLYMTFMLKILNVQVYSAKFIWVFKNN